MKKKQVVIPTPWYLAPLYSRGKFSPRLLMAWQAFYVACWLSYRYATARPTVTNGLLVQPQGVADLVGLFLGAVTVLLGLGTLQKIQLDAPSPPDTSQSVTEPSAESTEKSAATE